MSYFNFKEKKKGIEEKHPFSTLEIGDSFEIPSGFKIQSMRCLAYQRGESLGMKFKVSKLTRTVERVA